jgi:ubiquinone/menaquinone biosynthesis C-methylase UbiE
VCAGTAGRVSKKDVQGVVAPSRRVVGVDASSTLLAVASERTAEGGLSGLIALQEGDCRALPFPATSFDTIVAATVLTHGPDVDTLFSVKLLWALASALYAWKTFPGHPRRV